MLWFLFTCSWILHIEYSIRNTLITGRILTVKALVQHKWIHHTVKTNGHLHSQFQIYVLISLFNLTSFCSNVIVMFSVCDGNLSHCQPCNYTGYVSALQKGRDIFMELKDGNDYKGSHHFLPSYHRPVLS